MALESMAQRSIIQVFMDILSSYNSMHELLEEANRKNPEGMELAVARAMIKDAQAHEETGTHTLPQEQATETKPEEDPGAAQAQQRISTLEDQLQQEKDKAQELEGQVEELRSQLQAYQLYMGLEETAAAAPEEDPGETPRSREETVIEAITQPSRFPHLRFLNTASKNLANYGKSRPTGAEITSALEAIDTLAALYLESDNGSVGSWNEHLNLPGWTYSNSESEPTMGKYPKSRRFRDNAKKRHIVVQRHLTYRGSSGGLQLFFDPDGDGEPFVVAYIGEHLPYVKNRS